MSIDGPPGSSQGSAPPQPLAVADADEQHELFVPLRNVGLAYFCLVFLGWLGVHRFYVRRPFSGTLYAFTLGFFGIGLLVDLVLLPRLVRRVNEELRRAAAEDPEHFRKRERIAPWAHQDREGWSAQLLLVAGFWFIVTPLFAAITLGMGFESGPIYLAVTLIVIALFGSPHRLKQRYPKLEKVPVLEQVLERLVGLEDYYYEHKPRALIYYLCYPIAAPIAAIFSRPARAEAKMYARVHVLIAGVLALNIVGKWGFALWDETLPTVDAVIILVLIFLMTIMGLTAYVVPTTSTAFSLNLSGRRTQTLLLAAIGGGLAVPVSLAVHSCNEHRVTLPDDVLLSARLQERPFQCQLESVSRMVLHHELHERARGQAPPPPRTGEPSVVVDMKLTEKYRKILGGFISAGETKAFTVAVITWPDGGPTMLALVRDKLNPLRDRNLLHTASDDRCDSQPLVVIADDDDYLSTAALSSAYPGLIEQLAPRFHAGGELLLLEDWLAACANTKQPLDVARDCWAGAEP
ncbi:MAG: TM2 domain-containing protein [Myxococcales bacterium]|nr:TM2 domain-containing protein [Myxococcales bacterium]